MDTKESEKGNPSSEECIIDRIILDGKQALHEDVDFLPTRQSLYVDEKRIPLYDENLFHRIIWCRPQEIHSAAAYFDSFVSNFSAIQGTLPDDFFLGAVMALCVYPHSDLLQNIFVSRPEDFLTYGVYTCRFYVDGDWVEVTCDTLLPCLPDLDTGLPLPVYGRSSLVHELWIPLLEKAFAKAIGFYEAISTTKLQKILLHLTGGSVQYCSLRDEVTRYDSRTSDTTAWKEFKQRLNRDVLLLLLPDDRSSSSILTTTNENGENGNNSMGDMEETDFGSPESPEMKQENYFIPNKLYSVITYRDIGGNELVLMHSPWVNPVYVWSGEWSDSSNDWDLYPEILVELERDPGIPWRRNKPNGYFWISFRQMVKHFNRQYVCHMFPSDRFHFYCVNGESTGPRAGGPLTTIRDRDLVVQEAALSRQQAIAKSTAAVVIDGDGSWFNNPQYRVHLSSGTAFLYVSVIPQSVTDDRDAENTQMTVSVLRSSKHFATASSAAQAHLWDISQFEVVGNDLSEGSATPVKGQETSIWCIPIDSKHYYHIVPTTLKRGKDGYYILRVFCSKSIVMETLPPLSMVKEKGEWRRVGDQDTMGGPPTYLSSDNTKKDNPRWCQNPQFHVQLANNFGKEDVFLKIVLRRYEHHRRNSKLNSKSTVNSSSVTLSAADEKRLNATVGMVVCKADVLDEKPTKSKIREPRYNRFGEPIPLRESSLKKKNDPLVAVTSLEDTSLPTPKNKTILRRLQLSPQSFFVQTSYVSKTEATVFFPKVPRSWIGDGLLIIPSLSEKGAKGHFELEIYSSETVVVHPLPESFSRSVAGEWTESSAGGSHLSGGSWKKNPRFILRVASSAINAVDAPPSYRFRICVAKVGSSWKTSKKDTVGNMLGFYIFHVRGTESMQIYDAPFSPGDEIVTDSSFSLPTPAPGEHYVIQPCTFADGKLGSFVLSVLGECEFSLKKE